MTILTFFLTFFKDMFIGIVTLEFIAYFAGAFVTLSLFGMAFRFLLKGEY